MIKLILKIHFVIIWSLTLVSCTNEIAPNNYDYKEDVYTIQFTGDIDSFKTSFAVYSLYGNTTLLDYKDSILSVLQVDRVISDSIYSVKFRHPEDKDYSVVFSCTAISTQPDQYINGSIKRKRDDSVIIQENFSLKSVDIESLDFSRDDYIFRTSI